MIYARTESSGARLIWIYHAFNKISALSLSLSLSLLLCVETAGSACICCVYIDSIFYDSNYSAAQPLASLGRLILRN